MNDRIRDVAGRGSPSALRPWLGGLAAAVALLGGLAAAIGVFARGDGASQLVTSARGEVYEMAASGIYANNALAVVAEGIGWDLFTLLVAAPALLVASIGVLRGSFGAALVATGMLGYFFYLHLEYAVTWAFGPMFVVFVTLLAASVAGLIGFAALLATEGVRDRFADQFPRRSWAALSIAMSVLLVALWASRIADALRATVPDLHGETTMTVQALDLGLVVPVSVIVAVAALRRHPAGLVAAAAFCVTFATMSAAIGSMMVSSWIVTGTPAVEPIVVFGVAAALAVLIGIRIFSSLRSPTEGAALALRDATPAALASIQG